MRRIACIVALVVGAVGLFGGRVSAGSVPLNNGTWKDAQFMAYFTSNIEGVTPITTPFTGLSFQIDPTSLATYDTDSGVFAGKMKLLGSFNSLQGVITDLYLDFSTNDGTNTIGLGMTADGFPFGTIPQYFYMPTVTIAGNHLTGNGTTYTEVDPEPYQLDVDLPSPAAIPLPTALWPGLIGLATLLAALRFRGMRTV